MNDEAPSMHEPVRQSARNTAGARWRRPLQLILEHERRRAFGLHLWKQFREDRCFEAAAALSYTSLLALVPLMAVVLGVISAFPVFDRLAEEVQGFIFRNFVPAAGDVVQEYLVDFVSRTAGLTGAGTAFLLVTALLLMSTIERTLNRIWRVQTERRMSNRVVMYWSVLTLGPLLMGASLALTSYLAAVPMMAPEVLRSVLQTTLLTLTPFLVSLVAFTLIFVLVPNRRVAWTHALVGALLSAVLFEMAKRGFVLYVTNFPTYERLYGALAAVPLFLVWVYLSWVVILLGASITAALTTFRYRRADWRWARRHELLLAMRLLGHFWQAQRRGRGLSSGNLLSREPAATDAQLQRLLGQLQRARLVQRDDNGDWFIAADLDEVTLGEVYVALDCVLPLTEIAELPAEHHWDRAVIEALQAMNQRAEPFLQRSVKSYLRFEREENP